MGGGGERSKDIDLNRKELKKYPLAFVKMKKESEVHEYGVILEKDWKNLNKFTRVKPTCPAGGSSMSYPKFPTNQRLSSSGLLCLQE